MQKLKVTSFRSSDGFCYYYRLNYPLSDLVEKGLIEWHDTSAYSTEHIIDEVLWADVIIFQTASPFQMVKVAQDTIIEYKLNKVVLCEFDDDFFSIDPVNSYYANIGTEEVYVEENGSKRYIWKDGENGFDIERNKNTLKNMGESIAICDAVITSTEPLKNRLLQFNENTVELKNCLSYNNMPNQDAPKKRDNPEQVVISWAGGSSHWADIVRIIPTLEKVQRKYGDNVKFRFFGAYFQELYKSLNHEFIPWIKPRLYFDRFSSMLPDIGLIPIEDTYFNKAKSNIKFLEYSYYGIATISENNTPYKEHIKDGTTGFLYDNDMKLFSSICTLVESPLYRLDMAKKARNYVMRTHNIEYFSKCWYDLFIECLENKGKSYNLT